GKMERFFFAHLAVRVARRKNFNANFRSFDKADILFFLSEMLARNPGHIRRAHTIGGGNRTLAECASMREELLQQRGNRALIAAVRDSRWRADNDDLSVPVCFDATFDVRELAGEFAVMEDLSPALQIKRGALSLRQQFEPQRL